MSWFIWSTTLTVDQIDNRVVFVEWENESLSVIPKEWLPNDVQEGDTVTLSLKPTVRSNCVLNVPFDCPGLLSCFMYVSWNCPSVVFDFLR